MTGHNKCEGTQILIHCVYLFIYFWLCWVFISSWINLKVCRQKKSDTKEYQFSLSVMSCSLWPHGLQASLRFANSWSLCSLTSIESVTPSNHLILCRPLLLLPSVFPNIRVFSNESVLRIRWPQYWSFTFNITASNEHPGLISFRMDWLDLLAVQGTLKSLLQHRSSKASVLQCSAFFRVQLSNLYMTTGKTIAFSILNFVDEGDVSAF